MGIKIEKLDGNIVKLDIEIDGKTAQLEYDKACSKVAQKINIAGFRPGKAPKNIVEKNVGKEYIEKEALDVMLPKIMSDAIEKNDFDLISEPILDSYEYNTDKPTKVVIKFELKPEVKLGEYKNLTVDVEKFKNDPKALDKELEAIATRSATLETVKEKRATTNKDVVVMDFEGTSNGELIKGGASKNYTLDLGNSNFIPGFAEGLVDKNTGEEFTVNVTFPKEYHDEKLKGQPAEFKVTINEIKTRVTPKIDDELAKKAGNFKTLEALKVDIQKYLDNLEVQENDKRKTSAIFEKIVKSSTVDIQESMIEKEASAMLEDFKHRIQSQGGNFEKALESEGKDKVFEQLKEEAKMRIKNSLVIGEIAKQEKVEITPEDLNEKIAELATMYGTDKESIIKEIQKTPNILHQLTQQSLNQKVTKLLMDNNKVNFVEAKSVKPEKKTKK